MSQIEVVLDSIKLLLSIASKVMEMLPNYEQKKREEYFNLLKTYEDEMSRDYPLRDDNKVIQYRRALLNFVAVFADELDLHKKGIK